MTGGKHAASAAQAGILLMSYGGPQSGEDCEPYLRNLFLDPALVPIPSLLRPFLAGRMARRRAPKLRQNYASMGRFSPLLRETREQAQALERLLGSGCRCKVGMRYWTPSIGQACRDFAQEGVESIVLLPMFPHESATTTGTCVEEADRALKSEGWCGRLAVIRSFATAPGYLEAMAEGLGRALRESEAESRVLFCAHGLPVSIARRDPYPSQILSTVAALCERFAINLDPVSLDGSSPSSAGAPGGGTVRGALGWQGKVGLMRWLEPSAEEVIDRWGRDGVSMLIMVPVSFVSEHSETLYEMDVLMAGLARERGMTVSRVPAIGSHPAFVEMLSRAVREVFTGGGSEGVVSERLEAP